MSDEITITLTLTRDDAGLMSYAMGNEGRPDLVTQIDRAIERAESFVDDDESGNEEAVCAGCNGTGFDPNGTEVSDRCYYCSGTGKEYV